MKLIVILISSVVLSLSLAACDNDIQAASKSDKKVEGRWYTPAQLSQGKQIFVDNCAVCHGGKGQGLAKDWKKPLADGSYPPPPLNGTAHTWHHSMKVLLMVVNNGGAPVGGKMPAFKDKLSDAEKQAVIAHVMGLWSDEIYAAWKKRNP